MVLQLLALGINNVTKFDFMSPPPQDSLLGAVEQLYLLGAVEAWEEEEEEEEEVEEEITTSSGKSTGESYSLQLTPLGQMLAHFPLEPLFAKAIVTSPEQGCSHEVLSVVAMLSVDSVVFMPHDKQEPAAAVHRKFVSVDGDHTTLLNIYRAYKSVKGNKVRIGVRYCQFSSS